MMMFAPMDQVLDPFGSFIWNPPKKQDVWSGNILLTTNMAEWYHGDNAVVTQVGDYYQIDKTGGGLGIWTSGTVADVVAGQFITMSIEILAGTLVEHIVELTIDTDWSGGNGPGEFTILSGPGTFGYTNDGGQATVINLSTTVPTKVKITREVLNSGKAGISQWPGTFANTDGTILLRYPQIELGKEVHEFQPKSY